jgi:hypothetical protein
MSTKTAKNTEVMHMSFDEKTGYVLSVCPGMMNQIARDLEFVFRLATNVAQQVIGASVGHPAPDAMGAPAASVAPSTHPKKKAPRRAR